MGEISKTYRETISRAANIAGGADALGARLGVATWVVAGWIEGDRVPPTRYFLQAVDILDEHTHLPSCAKEPRHGA